MLTDSKGWMDRTIALANLGDDEELLSEIAELFLTEYPAILADARQAATDRDPLRLERAAHSLKGSVANFGAEDAYQAAMQLELMGRSRDLKGVEEAYAALEN